MHRSMRHSFVAGRKRLPCVLTLILAWLFAAPLLRTGVWAAPKVILVAALDTTDDHTTNYDRLAFFDATLGIQPGPFSLPSTGPAYEQVDRHSSPFYLAGSSNKAGTAFFVSALAPDLSIVRIARYSANFIPRNPPIIAFVDDINNNVGFWLPQPDFRIAERLSPGFKAFPDLELETIYRDQVCSFTDYQTRIALCAISQNPDADLIMTYFEQPDGSSHQLLLIAPRQPTDFTNPTAISEGQDTAKVARYRSYVQEAYQVADQAVQAIIDAIGTAAHGAPNSNINRQHPRRAARADRPRAHHRPDALTTAMHTRATALARTTLA